MKIIQTSKVEELPSEWDELCDCYFQKRKFLAHCEKYNPCYQRYYYFVDDHRLIAGCVAYKLEMNLFTFIGKDLTIKPTIIGIPVSVSCSGILGNKKNKKKILPFVLGKEKGLVLIMNEDGDLGSRKMRVESLPTILFSNRFTDPSHYLNQMRKSYRRKYKKAHETEMDMVHDEFTPDHYKFYLEIMKYTPTKLETLSFDFFANLAPEFHLRTLRYQNEIITWNITLNDDDQMFFFFGGLNYDKNKQFHAYFKNLYDIIFAGIRNGCKTIDLGQTAEIAKIRVGGFPIPKFIYFHHSNIIINIVFILLKRFFQYKRKLPPLKVFKNENFNDST